MSKPSRHRRSRWGWIALMVAAAGLLLAQGCASSAPASGRPGQLQVGSPAPDFTLTDLAGNQVSLSDFRGKAVFINFWATWCPPCREEMPEIEAIYQKYKDRDVAVIGVDILEKEDVVRRFVQEGGYSWTFVIDTTGEVTTVYKVTAIPTSYFIDGNGIIRAVAVGAMTRTEMEARLAGAMR
ncbi:MAG: redoxin domain-containing protein [Chloroflexi bacterium]|nr:redoxin domain-containing protein [Chloroflexota bacterium]